MITEGLEVSRSNQETSGQQGKSESTSNDGSQERISLLGRFRDKVLDKAAKTKWGQAIGQHMLDQISIAGGLKHRRMTGERITNLGGLPSRPLDEEEKKKKSRESRVEQT